MSTYNERVDPKNKDFFLENGSLVLKIVGVNKKKPLKRTAILSNKAFKPKAEGFCPNM